jgi:hypothetical protein
MAAFETMPNHPNLMIKNHHAPLDEDKPPIPMQDGWFCITSSSLSSDHTGSYHDIAADDQEKQSPNRHVKEQEQGQHEPLPRL